MKRCAEQKADHNSHQVSKDRDDILARTKELIMEKYNISEKEAHRYIQKCAMNSGTDIAEVCEMLILLHGKEN